MIVWCIVAPIKTTENKHRHADETYNKYNTVSVKYIAESLLNTAHHNVTELNNLQFYTRWVAMHIRYN